MITTTDALGEGVFRLLVNFDVSDTGQSVTPRRGFLTTSLKDVHVSANSIVFQDTNSNKYIIFDFDVVTGYIVEIGRASCRERV